MKPLYQLPILLLFLTISPEIPNCEGVLIKHTFEVSYFPGSPDGVYKDKVLGINGQFPGPTIEAFVGDTLEVTLLNKIQDKQNVTIHWHGMHQRGSLFEDGTNQIAQCPLPYGSFQVYRFNLTKAGTYWYHSHVRSQYTEGLLGALIVRDQEEHYKYDGDITLVLTDWYHRTAHENEEWYLSPASKGLAPYPDSALINGHGRYPCNIATLQNRSCLPEMQKRQVYTIPSESTYRIRIINGGALTFFNFSIDGHRLQTIEADGIEVAEPVDADVVSIGPGERYSFLVRPPLSSVIPKNNGRFLIRSAVRKEFLRNGENINEYPQALFNEVTAVLHRSDDANATGESEEVFAYNEILPPPLYPNGDILYLNEMDLLPLHGGSAPDYYDEEHILVSTSVIDENGVARTSFNGTPFSLPEDKPLLMSLIEDDRLPSSAVPIVVGENNVIQLVFNNPFGVHPFHLHGHHFWVVGLGQAQDGSYDSEKHSLATKAPLRDTVVVPANSYAVIRFIADNPGVWTVHCHLDWHNLGGMAATIVEAWDIIRADVKITEEAERICWLHR